MKKIYALALLAFTVTLSTSNAQLTFGPKIGGNLSKLTWKEGENNESDPNYEYKPGWQIGGIIDFQLCEQFSIRPGVSVNKLSTQYKTEYAITEDEETSYTATYIQVPLDFVVSLPLSAYHLKLSVGPYFQRGISGKVVKKSGNTSNEKEILFKEIPENYNSADGDVYANPWDYGINFGIGYQIEYFLISFQYGLSLSNYSPKYEVEPENYNRNEEAIERWSNFTFSLAYLFHPENE